ncbi:MAG: class I SAM-dependent methyltransferase [Sphingomonas sp.]|nr:class I SAM-dependent methyltransferase [Sphingomonas sp.]
MSDSDRAWQTWGTENPYFGVLSEKKFRKDSIDLNRDEFFKSGIDYIDNRLKKFERLFGQLEQSRALDFGCGVGRLTLPLAGHFYEAVGIDISSGMLKEAQNSATALGISNVNFVQSDDKISNSVGKFDFVYTYIVLQHIPVNRGLVIIGQLLDRVRAGGGVSLHFSVDRRDSAAQKLSYWARTNVPMLEAVGNIARGRSRSEPLMQMNEYPLEVVLRMMMERGFGDVVTDLEYHGRILTASVMARRA